MKEGEHYILGGDFNIEGGSDEYNDAVKLIGRESVCAPEFRGTYSTHSFLTPPGWRDVEYNVNLDHVFTDLHVDEYKVTEVWSGKEI